MSPGTFINPWQDLSNVQQQADVDPISYRPLIMVASSFDKGPEEMTRCYGDEFFNLYGKNPSFAKHGQAGIQSTRIALAGAELLVKRMVAADAEIANLILGQRISEITDAGGETDLGAGVSTHADIGEAEVTFPEEGSEDQGTDGDDGNGGGGNDPVTPPTTEDPTTPTEPEQKAYSVRWEALSVEGCKTYDDVYTAAMKLHTEDPEFFPLIIVSDNGRGVSSKAIRLTPNYEVSKGYGITFFTLRVFEGTKEIDKKTVTFNPNVVIGESSYGMYHEDTSKQVKITVDQDMYMEYLVALADKLCVPPEDIQYEDLINMRTFKGLGMENIELAEDSVDLNANYGISLRDGSNGSFGNCPIKSEALTQAYISFFSGEETDEIYDLNIHKICAIFDANYPIEVKETIARWVSFREDMYFFRDLGVGIRTYLDIVAALAENKTNNKFIGNYMTSYMIYEPSTHKRVEVTMMYDFAPAMVSLFSSGAYVPTAGTTNSMILRDPIPGTVNFVPRNTPTAKQLDLLEELRVNYAIFENVEGSGNCVVQTLYTSQDKNTQLIYINNVLAVQEVIREIRTTCPKNRYSFQTGNDFSAYAKDVAAVLQPYKSHFSHLEFKYEKDDIMADQKIFNGVLEFAFNSWFQTEIFDVVIINSGDVADETPSLFL